MTPADVNRWFGQNESQTLDFVNVADNKRIASAVCGMLNANGGVVVVGVSDDGSVIGLDNVDSSADDIDAYLLKQISPPAPCALFSTEVDGNTVIVIDVPNGPNKPYVTEGKIFVRVGNSNRLAVADDISRLIQHRLEADQHWESRPAVSISTSDLDTQEIQRAIRESVEAGRFEPGVTDPVEVLRRFNLLFDNRPNQAAAVAFAAKVMPWYPQCTLRLARFRGITKEQFVDQQKVSGHAFLLLDEAHKFLGKHLPVQGTFQVDSLRRRDKPLYPTLALREALVNAICHRDYSIAGGAISVAIFDDRLEIASTGMLPPGLTIADLKSDHFSQPRNPLLADVFYRRGLIELWGRGTQGIVRLCLEVGCPEPQFEERAGEFVVRFFAPNYAAALPEGLDLSERQSRVFAVLQGSMKRTLKQIKESVDPSLSDSTIRNELNRLRELGLVEAVGVGRGAFWRVARLSPSPD
jgi:ATP-dependent DNA helicase RecG